MSIYIYVRVIEDYILAKTVQIDTFKNKLFRWKDDQVRVPLVEQVYCTALRVDALLRGVFPCGVLCLFSTNVEDIWKTKFQVFSSELKNKNNAIKCMFETYWNIFAVVNQRALCNKFNLTRKLSCVMLPFSYWYHYNFTIILFSLVTDNINFLFPSSW